MLKSGVNSDSICSLSGAVAPFNSFEMAELVDSSLEEQGATFLSSAESAARTVTSIRSEQVLDGKLPIDSALAELSQLCIDLGDPSRICDFYHLHLAKEELKFSDHQWYWPSAAHENIDQVATQRLQEWVGEHTITT
ncbi:MAG: hypothetical protein ACRBCJ_13600 [Hyphomicrobiaceae bacterium]